MSTVFQTDAFLEEAKNLTPSTLVPFVVKLAQEVNKLTDKTGQEKKALVMETVTHLLETCKAASDEKDVWDQLLKLHTEITSTLLDTAVAVARGKLDLSRPVQAIVEDPKVMSTCFALLCSLVKVAEKKAT
jgi:hypothetical protein